MIKFNPDVRIVGIDSSYSEGEDVRLSLYFNTMHTIISPKSVLDVLYMLNGLFISSDISSSDFGHKGIDSNKILRAVQDYGIVSDSKDEDSEEMGRFFVAQNRLNKYTAHFQQISNVNVMIAMMLQKMNVKCIFYSDAPITSDDISQNIYFERSDAGRLVSSVLKESMGAANVLFERSWDEASLLGDEYIFVNFDPLNWTDSDRYIVINTWNYSNTRFGDFCLFNEDRIDVSNDLKELIDGYTLAIRSIDDIVYNIRDGLVQ